MNSAIWFDEMVRNETEDAQYREDVRAEREELARVMRHDAALELVGYVKSLRDMGELDGLHVRHLAAISEKLRRAGA